MLGGLTPQEFLGRYWQKEPLLVRDALQEPGQSFSYERLVALAARSRVASRLIVGPRDGASWTVRRGPFAARDFDELPDGGWTLLVQEVDRHVRLLAALLDRFRFIPNWRVDDVMVSHAADGGGIGPHIDRHDVFLIQGSGRRRWRIVSSPVEEERFAPGTELPVLAEFEPDREWLLEPGDMLYLPPRIAHEGVAVGACMTYSVGFRTPDPRELCAGFIRQLGPAAFDEIRYADPDLRVPEHLGEIPAEARRRLRETAARLFTEGGEFDRWLGRFVTRPLRSDRRLAGARTASVTQLRERIAAGAVLRRHAISYFAWQRDDDGIVQLFVGGEDYPLGRGAEAVAELLCGSVPLDAAALAPHMTHESFVHLLIDLLLRGFLVVSGEPTP